MKIGFRFLPLLWALLCSFVFFSCESASAAPEKELQISTNEIRLDGTIRELKTTSPHMVLDATSFSLPSGKSQKFAAPKSKPVVVNAQCWIHSQGELAARLKLSDLKLGEVIVVIGRDGGSGQPLLAREIIVRRNKGGQSSASVPDKRDVSTPEEDEKLPTQPQLVVQMGHPGVTMRAAVSPKGKFFASGDSKGGVKIWNLDTGDLYCDLPGHYGINNKIRSMAFSPDGKYLATGAETGPAKVWHVASGKLARNLALGDTIVALDFAPVKSPLYSNTELPLVVASYTQGTKIINALTGDLMQSVRSSNPEAMSGTALFSPDGTYVARVTNGNIEIWDTVSEKVVTIIPYQMGGVFAMAFSPDGKLLAATSFDRNMKLWDVASGRELVKFPQQSNHVNLETLCFSASGDALWVPSGQGVQSWDLATALSGTPTPTPLGTRISNIITVTPQWVLTRSSGTEVRRTSDFQVVSQTGSNAHNMEKMALSPDGTSVAAGGFSSEMHVWDITSGVRAWSGNGSTWDFSFSPDSKSLATINSFPPNGNNLILWTLPAGKLHTDYQLSGLCVAYSSDGLIAVGGNEGQVKLFDARNRKILKDLPDGKTRVSLRQLAFSADGSLLARHQYSGSEIEIWNARKGEHVQTIKSETPINSFAFSPDGKTMATCSQQPGIQFWNLQSGEMTTELKTDSPLKAVAFSRDGSLLAGILANENKVQVWNRATAETKATLQDEASLVDVAFSMDGKVLVTASANGHIRLWDVVSGRWKVTMRAVSIMNVQEPDEWIAYTPEGYYIGSENIDNKLRWRVGRNLLPASSQKAAMFQPSKVQAALTSLFGQTPKNDPATPVAIP